MISLERWHTKRCFNRMLIITLLVVALVLTMLFAIGTGPAMIPSEIVAKIFLNKILPFGPLFSQTWPPSYETIVMNIRLPRVILGILVGSALATAGCAVQGLFKNPMACPYILGVSSGAAFGAALSMMVGISMYSLPFTAFIFGLLAVFLVYFIAKTGKSLPIDTLLLSGVAVGSFFTALVSFLIYAGGEEIHGIVFWLMGGLWLSNWSRVTVAFFPIMLGITVLFFFARDMNAILLGEEPALHLGIEVETVKKIILIVVTLITAASVSVTGTIGFIGLIIPHMMRLVVGPDHRILLPASVLFGAIFLLCADTLARGVAQPTEMPVGIITALFGVPFFIYLLKTKRGKVRW